MTASEFRDLADGFQSIAIVLATFLGGGWALFQFFSLRALDKAKLELDKMRRELIQRGILLVDVSAHPLESDGEYFLHTRVSIRNIGTGFEIADWNKATLFARRFHKGESGALVASEQPLLGWRSPSVSIREMRFMPGYSTSESFLIGVPQPGIYYIEFSIPVSPAVKTETIADIATYQPTAGPDDDVLWRADTVVSVPARAQPAVPADGLASLGRG